MKTVGIDETTHKELKKIAKQNEKDMGSFIASAVTYFKATGIDPEDEKQSPKKAIEENNKRLNQVIAFIKKQESDHLFPILKKMMENNQLLNSYVERLKPEVFKNAYNETTDNLKILQEKMVNLELQQQIQIKQMETFSTLLKMSIRVTAYEKGLLGGDKKEKEEILTDLKRYVR